MADSYAPIGELLRKQAIEFSYTTGICPSILGLPGVDGRLKARISGEERASGPNIFTGCTAEKLPVERPLA